MKQKVEQKVKRSLLTFILVLLLLSISICIPTTVVPIVKIAFAGNLSFDSDSSTNLSITSLMEEEPPGPPGPSSPPTYKTEPIINWYDFQTKTGLSKLNSKIDVNQEYKFCINISSDQGWDDIEYIDITAWFDNGDDGAIYNQTKGGNLNIFLRYENTTGIASYTMFWPDEEVTIKSFTEKIEADPNSNSVHTECHNLTFSFIPGYQFRYAPGDGNWDKTKNAINDIYSWNFIISVTDNGEQSSGPITTSIVDEFGVNTYNKVTCAGIPSIQGVPGETASADSNITLNTCSNANYSLSVDIDTFLHKLHPTASMSNQTIWIQGGDLTKFANFMGDGPIYLYGSLTTFAKADDDNTARTTNNVDFICDIPVAQIPGNYRAVVRYQMLAQI